MVAVESGRGGSGTLPRGRRIAVRRQWVGCLGAVGFWLFYAVSASEFSLSSFLLFEAAWGVLAVGACLRFCTGGARRLSVKYSYV